MTSTDKLLEEASNAGLNALWHSFEGASTADEVAEAIKSLCKAQMRRISSDAKKIEAADELGSVVSSILEVDHPIDMTSKDCLERVHCALSTALEAYRKAGGEA